jgi:hypothetical protein
LLDEELSAGAEAADEMPGLDLKVVVLGLAEIPAVPVVLPDDRGGRLPAAEGGLGEITLSRTVATEERPVELAVLVLDDMDGRDL